MNRELYRLFNIDSVLKYDKYYKFIDAVNEEADYTQLLPDYLHAEYNKDIKDADHELEKRDNNYKYIDLFKRHESLLTKLVNCKLNKVLYKVYTEIEKNDSLRNNLKSFSPYFGEVYKPKYNLNANITGRLTISEGPNILTLPKKYRPIIDTRFKNGKVISVDFSSLEPRVCLGLVDKSINGDLYEVINNILEIDVDRTVIKRAIISVLYGAHFSTLQGISKDKSEYLFKEIHKYFNLDKILKMASYVDENGLRKNFFGRPLWNIKETKENILINNYVQSTAVDLSLLYFSDLTEQIDLKKAVPLFILHDAMIFDLNEEYESEFVNIVNKGYNHLKLGHFPLEIDIFNTRKED